MAPSIAPGPFTPDTALPCAVAPSPNHGGRRGRTIDAIVLHYTGMPTAAGALALLTDPASQVSSHYLVDETGALTQLVPEKRRAWHAGQSFWQGERDLNSVSIGIEIANPGHAGGLPSYPDRQIDAVVALCRDLMARHAVPAARVLAHSDIAPGRKIDPGERFPWRQLADHGVGVWPAHRAWPAEAQDLRFAVGARGDAVAALQRDLADIGFETADAARFDARTRVAIVAFQQRYRAANVDGVVDAETLSIVATVAALSRSSERPSGGS